MVELHTEALADHEWKEVAFVRKKIDPVNKEFSTSQSVKLPPAENPQADLEKLRLHGTSSPGQQGSEKTIRRNLLPSSDSPAEDLYGIFINRVRRERPPEYLEKVKGLTKWVPPPVKMTSSYVRQNIDISQKRMDVASLDMLQFHWWDYAKDGYLDALKHLTDLKEEGKIKTVALTNFDTKRLEIILENGIPVVSNHVQYSIVDMRPQQRMAQLCLFECRYGTVMGGLLSEKFLHANLTIPFASPGLNTPSLQKYKRMVDAWGGWNLFQGLLRTMKSIATKHGVSIPTVAVRYVLDQQGVGESMIGVRLG
ncbi:NAD(P)-linked oxidoreductase superfamily protein [Raphanus sativus]|nr:NAD(P)-linked oxidoreductase superfamily protein [Raphanus sativus]